MGVSSHDETLFMRLWIDFVCFSRPRLLLLKQRMVSSQLFQLELAVMINLGLYDIQMGITLGLLDSW